MKLKKKNELRRFTPETVVYDGIQAEFSNRTKLARSSGFISLTCEVCGTSFTRKASEARRHAHSYCGMACRGAAQRKRVDTSCKICGKPFQVKASHFGRVTCCGPECNRKSKSETTRAMNIAGWKVGMFPVGENAPAAKLTERQVIDILSDARGNADIAKDYGVERHTIRFIKIRKTWTRGKRCG